MIKKIVLLLVIGLIVTIPNGTIFDVPIQANSATCEATQYGLSNINMDKTWTNIGCYTSLEEAKVAMTTEMNNHSDLIITHNASLSPLKIVAASRAVAASYPFRSGSGSSNSNTVYIYRNSNLTGDTTYMTYHLDMAYYETVSFNATNGNGSAKVQISGFVGYIPLAQIDIVPLIYVENDWEITLGGKTYLEVVKGQTGQEQPFTLKPKLNEYRVSTNSAKNVREVSHGSYSWWDGRSYGRYVVGIAPEWLANGTYFSWDGIHFYTDKAMTQPVKVGENIGEYYNYYLYLPLRSSSNYTASELDAYLNSKTSIKGSIMVNEGKAFVDAQNKYGMNALLVYALAIHESGHGTSSIAKAKNNLFGWGAYDSNPGDAYMFESVSQSVSEHIGINLRGYLSIENWRYFGQAYATKDNGLNTKYASDPYWGYKIAAHAYSIDRFHNYKDYAQFNIGIINKDGNITVKKEANSASSTLFTMGSKLRTQSVLLTDSFKVGNDVVYEIMSPMPVSNGKVILFNDTSKQLVEYDWHQSRGYLINEPVHVAYQGVSYPSIPNVVNQQLLAKPSLFKINALEVKNKKLTLSGYHIQEGLSISSKNQLIHELTLIDPNGVSTTVTLTTTQDNNLSSITKDGRYNVSNMGFSGTFDFPKVIDGMYTLKIKSTVTVSKTPIVYSNELKLDIVNLPANPVDPEEPTVLLGDVNGDGLVDVLDLAKISRHLAELDDLTGNFKLAADLNSDGLVDVLDLARLSRILAELE